MERGVAAAKLATLPQSPQAPESSPTWNEPEPVALPEPPAGAYFTELPIDAIVPNRHQPREVFDEDALAELVTSIKEVGLLQPVVVRKIEADRYELVMGERRLAGLGDGGPGADPGDRPGHRRREDAPGRAPGEPSPGPAERDRRGPRLRAAAQGLRLHS
ncbi:ParB/RepB/Spo0J family partition protein [Allokutzneria sp. NRRL B-24872]|uniref:ParB N-terminal domain-containing protein n=1 Tax=Allokutzneria sp. NRRL B-24872 TaxID=1137961 RepID=UPI00352F7C04